MNKEGKMARRTLVGLITLALILVISISTAIAVQVKNELVEKYSSFALSYVKSAAEFIDGDTIEQYYHTGKKDEYYENIRHYLKTTTDMSAESANIQYFYVFVPEENDFVYIWDAEAEEEPAELLDHYPYSEGAKEQAEKIMNRKMEHDVQYYTDSETGDDVLTVSIGIKNSKDDIVAIVAADISVNDINESSQKVISFVIVSVVSILALAIIAYYQVMKKYIVDPIVTLHKTTENLVENIEDGKEIKIDVKTNDELEMLADSITEMDLKLRDYIRQNAAITAEKERIGTELELATRIQADMLPNIFPPFPERSDFDIFASMTPAKEVGGDFYDFFLIDDSHLALVMADVSGKGVPAALFMMMSKILIKNAALSGKTPKEVLTTVNNQICANNKEEMFVTVWLGFLDLKTGLLTAANAGHEKPMLKMADGDFEFYNDKHGFVLGGMAELKYREYEIQLEKDSKLFIYTDGVPEATSADDELFGTERTLESLNKAKDESPKAILESVKNDVDAFVGDAPQFDDLTMLCIHYIGEEDVITIEARTEEVEKAVEFVARKAEALPFSSKEKYQIEIAVDELVCNIASYAYEDKVGTATVRVSTSDVGIKMVIVDSGIPYNPLEKEDPDITLSAEERGIGGYGIFIVKKVMDEIEYERKDGKNILTIRKTFSE